jgi:group I intron endonuclease
MGLFDPSLKSGIYVITCLPLQKHYIGQSSNVKVRLNAHKSTLMRNCHCCAQLQADYNHYGQNQFVFQKLLFGATLSKELLEQFETTILLTLPPEQRYNKYTNWRKRAGETNAFYGKTHTMQARQAQSIANQGKVSGFAAHTQSNSIKQLLSQQNSGKSSMERRKALFIDSVYYESITEASEKTGFSRRLIRQRCHSTEQRFKNYQWFIDKSKEKLNDQPNE